MIKAACKSPTRTKTLFSYIVCLTFMLTWLPFLRSVSDGSSYVWGITWFGQSISGSGLDGAFPFLVVQVALYAALLTTFYRVADRRYFHVLAVLWFVNIFGSMVVDIWLNGDLMFHGDTMGVHVSINWLVYVLGLLSLVLVIAVIREDRASASVSIPWGEANTFIAAVLLCLLPVQVLLLASGEPHGLTDKVGVLISIAECFALPLLIRPYPVREQSPAPAVALQN